MTVLVDSDILIEVARGRNAAIIARWTELSRSDTAVLYSSVSVAELWAGARANEHDFLNDLFRALTVVSVDSEIARRAGDYLRQYRKSHGMELGDALIAASAVSNNARLWTRNHKHYPIKDLSFF